MSALLGLLVSLQGVLAARVVARFLSTLGGERISASQSVADARVGVVIPVLDEEARLPDCLAGAIAQPAEVARILVVDGGSQDGTRSVVASYAARDARVELVDASPVPSDWTGKVWGQHAGASRAGDVDWILFLDADVRIGVQLVRSLLAHAQRTGVRAMSAAPRQLVSGAAQALLHPAFLATLVYRFGSPGHATTDTGRVQGNGQCFLVHREVLRATGALESARDSLCEDITIVRRIAETGEPVGLYELEGGLAEVAMYGSAREAWDNWTRSLPMRDRYFGAREVTGLAEIAFVQALPLLALMIGAAVGAPVWLLAFEAGLACMRFGVHVGLARAYASPPAAFWLAPLVDGAAIGRILQRAAQRRQVWRGRSYVRQADGGFRLEEATGMQPTARSSPISRPSPISRTSKGE